MLGRLTAVGMTPGVFFFAAAAQAQAAGTTESAFGNRGEFIISADRLFPAFGFSHASATEFNTPAGDTKAVDTDTQTNLGLFWGSTEVLSPGNAGVAIENFYTVPRVGFDYTIIDHLTIGGDIAFMFTPGGTHTHEDDLTNGGTRTASNSEPTTTVFGVAPRAGYVLPLSDLFGLWLRGGFSYYTGTVSTSNTNGNATTTFSVNVNQFALDLDPQLVITPVAHFGFNVGLTADIPLAGGYSQTTTQPNGSTNSASAGSSLFFIGATAGIFGWFGG